MSWLELLLVVLAVARLTVLVRADRISRPIRYAVAKKLPENGYLLYLLDCPWCIGMWISAAAAISAYFCWHDAWFRILTFALALSYVVGALAAMPWEPDSDLPKREAA